MNRISFALPFLFASALAAQTQWVNFPATTPGTLAGHDLVATSGAAVLFGGENPKNTYHNDTWTWDTASLSWTLQTPANAPSIRAAHEMAYDPIRNKVVLFGGWNGGLWYNQTWEWDGTNWAQMTPNNIPTARDWLAMEFDPISQRIILFGGHTTSGWPNVPNAFGDTWAWDGTDWTQLSPATAPALRFGHEMALDTRRGRIVMYGGFSRLNSADPGTAYNETWEWTGSDWLQIPTAHSPTVTTFFGMAYDPRRERTVVYGGVNGSVTSNEVWEYDAADWTQRTLVGTPLAICHSDGIFDASLGRIINYGGGVLPSRNTLSDQTDFYSAVNDAYSVRIGRGCAGSAGVPTLDHSHLAWVGGTYQLDLSSVPAGALHSFVLGFSRTRTGGGLALPFDLSVVGMAGCSLYVDNAMSVAGVANGSGAASLSLSIPAIPSLVGMHLYSQGFVVDLGSTLLGLTSSNGCEHVIGAR